MSNLRLQTAKVFQPLFAQARYKGAWGGRGSGKSHYFAESALREALRFPGDYGVGLSMVCIREVQRDLKHSAKKLIEDKMMKFGLLSGQGFKVFKDCIVTPGDGLIIFQGMQDYNADSIKSLEAFHRSWAEESHTLSQRSLDLLKPTMRWEDVDRGGYAEMWFSWNPSRRTDSVDLFLRQGTPPTDSVVVKANWQDNPWFPAILDQERNDCYNNDFDQYDHIWDGGYQAILKGAYFAKQLGVAKHEGRLTRVNRDPYFTNQITVDIGGTGAKSDNFVMWVTQWMGREIRVIDYYEAQGQDFETHLAWMRKHDYTPENSNIILPHDGATHDKVIRVSYESAFKDVGYKVRIIKNQGTGAAMARVEEVRRLFPIMYFDKERCAGGLDALAWYHEKIDEVRQIGLGPKHDWASHGADAFGLTAVAYKAPTPHNAHKPVVNTLAKRRRGR